MLINRYSIEINDITGMSREQRLISKEHIATHTNLTAGKTTFNDK